MICKTIHAWCQFLSYRSQYFNDKHHTMQNSLKNVTVARKSCKTIFFQSICLQELFRLCMTEARLFIFPFLASAKFTGTNHNSSKYTNQPISAQFILVQDIEGCLIYITHINYDMHFSNM